LASAQETSSLLIEKGKRDATAWFEAMELGPLVAAQQAQQQVVDSSAAGRQQQKQGQVILGSGRGQQQQQGVAGDWSDDKAHERSQEAERAQQATAEAEADGGVGGGDPLPRGAGDLLQTAAAVDAAANGDGGPTRAAVKHAAEVDAAGVVGPPNKRHKAAAAAATVAAAANAAAEGVASVLGKGDKQHQQREE
jgi:hypothetical protein